MNMARNFFLLILITLVVGCVDSSSPGRAFVDTTPPPASEGDGGAGDEGAGDGDGDAGDGDETPTEPVQESILITPSLGLINGADVTVTQADGTPIEGASGTLDATGTVTIEHDGAYTGPIVVTVTGNDSATYFDESAGTNLPMGSDISLRAYAPSPLTSVGVTILTELAAQVMDSVEGAITAETVASVNDTIRMTLAPDVPDILTAPVIVSEDNITAQSLGTDDAGVYALRLAALANMAADDAAPAISILNQLAADLSDGDIDGEDINGPIADLDYAGDTFSSLFQAAADLAAATLADADLMSTASGFQISLDANVLEELISAGIALSDEASDILNPGSGGGDGGVVDISGDYDLTISGEIVTFGIGTSFGLTIENIVAPSPSDTEEVRQVILDTVAGVSGITSLSVTIINNSADQITFDVSLEAQQSGVAVTMNLRYDYVPAGSGGSDAGGDTGGSDGDSGDAGGSAGDIAALGEVCLFGGEAVAATLPAFLTASTWTLEYFEANPGAPYTADEVRTFVFSSSGRLFVDDVQIADTPVFCNGNEREAIWKDLENNLIYSVSDLSGNFNEVNVNSADGGTFLGQFTEI